MSTRQQKQPSQDPKQQDPAGKPRPDLSRDAPDVHDAPIRRDDDRPRPGHPDPAPIAGEDEDGAMERGA